MLTEGGTQVWAICIGCNERSGNSLRRAWLSVVGWFLLPILLLIGLLAVLGLLR